MSGPRPHLVLVSPRPPRRDGQGDQRRAHTALTALRRDWDVEVISWLPDAEESLSRRWRSHPLCVVRTAFLSTRLPVHVAYVQSLAPRGLTDQLRRGDPIVFITDRAVPRLPAGGYVIDFIDDLGGAALRRATSEQGPRAWFWRWEGRRLRRLDARLAVGAMRAVAVTEHDASAIHPRVETIRYAIGTDPLADDGTKVAFTGNLFYSPNLDAALWICKELAPELARRGVDPSTVVVAGRRPPRSLTEAAATAGITLMADVPDLTEVVRDAAVVLCPVVFGSGVQSKLLDAVGARRATVLTPFANEPLGLVDGQSALVRERSAPAFAEGIIELLGAAQFRRRLAARASEHLSAYSVEAVDQAWRDCLQSAYGPRS